MVSLWSNLKACASTSGRQLLSMTRGAIENGSCNLAVTDYLIVEFYVLGCLVAGAKLDRVARMEV